MKDVPFIASILAYDGFASYCLYDWDDNPVAHSLCLTDSSREKKRQMICSEESGHVTERQESAVLCHVWHGMHDEDEKEEVQQPI